MAAFTEYPHWLWLDIEATGSDPAKHEVLEIGAVCTTPKLEVLFEDSWLIDSVLDPAKVNRRVKDMHTVNGLWLEWINGPRWSLERVSILLGKLLQDAGIEKGERVLLCGSGVSHFDRRFIETKDPQFFKRFGCTYFALDVGVIRRFFGWDQTRSPERSVLKHRALDDCYNAIEQYRFFRDSCD